MVPVAPFGPTIKVFVEHSSSIAVSTLYRNESRPTFLAEEMDHRMNFKESLDFVDSVRPLPRDRAAAQTCETNIPCPSNKQTNKPFAMGMLI